MRYATRQLSESFHFLRLGELLLCPLQGDLCLPSLGDVMRDMHKASERARVITNRLNHNASPKFTFVPPHAPTLERVFALVGSNLKRPSRLAGLLLFLGIKSTKVSANNLFSCIQMNALGTHVPIRDASIPIKHKDGVISDSLNNSLKAPFAFYKSLPRLACFGKIISECVFGQFSLLNFGIECCTRLGKARSAFLNRIEKLLALAGQIVFCFATSSNIFSDCHEVTYGIRLIYNGRDVASDPQLCTGGKYSLALNHETFADANGLAKQIRHLRNSIGLQEILKSQLQ